MEAATYVQISKPTFAAPLFTTPHREKWDEFPGMNLSLHFNDLFAPVDLTDSFIAPSPVTSLSYTFSAGCQYIVPKYVLISRTVEFYKHIARCLKRGVDIKLDELRRRRNYEYGEIDGWTMERLFAFIWNIKYEANPV